MARQVQVFARALGAAYLARGRLAILLEQRIPGGPPSQQLELPPPLCVEGAVSERAS